MTPYSIFIDLIQAFGTVNREVLWIILDRYEDECALLAHDKRDLQMIADKFSQASKLFSLTINISKTEVLYQPAPNTNPQEPTITLTVSSTWVV